MTRDSGALVDARIDDAGILLGSPGGLVLLGMIIMSLSTKSMVIFACGDANSRKGILGVGGAGSGGGGGCGGYRRTV
jgi:hypothetical protein